MYFYSYAVVFGNQVVAEFANPVVAQAYACAVAAGAATTSRGYLPPGFDWLRVSDRDGVEIFVAEVGEDYFAQA